MRVIKETLDNGLTVILAPMAGAETTVGLFAVKAGNHYEILENQGIAHFLEHMAFKGTERRPTTLDIAKEVEGRGGIFNAFTDNETTMYYIKLSSEHIDVILDVLSDMLFHSKLDPEEIEREKGTIIEELRRRDDDPATYVASWLWPKLLYGDQPAGREIFGTEESIKGIERKHFLDFINGLYTSENSVFCLVGKIRDRENLFSKIVKFFEPIKQGKPTIIKPSVTESQTERALMLECRDISQSHLILGVRSYGYNHPKLMALNVLDTILGGNMSSRLFIEVREKRGLAYAISTFVDDYSDTGNFGTWAGIKREKTSEAIKVILNEYARMCAEKVSEEELERAKSFIVGTSKMTLESSGALSQWLSRQWLMEGKIKTLAKKIKEVRAVTVEDIQSVAQEIFMNKGLNLAIVGPHQGMEEEFLKILKF